MKLKSLFTVLTVTLITHAFAAEETAVIKAELNTPVYYHTKLKFTAQQKVDSAMRDVGKGNIQMALVGSVSGNVKPYELLVTPKNFSFDVSVGGLAVSYDTNIALKSNSIPQEKVLVQTVIDHLFHIPLTNDPSVGDSNDPYVIKLFNDPENKIVDEKELTEVIQAIETGITFKAGKTEEYDLESNNIWDKGHVTRTITQVDKSKVVIKEQVTVETSSFANGENPEEGGYTITGKGEFVRSIQRSNWMLMDSEGGMVFQITELAGPNGKQALTDGDLMINVEGKTTSEPSKGDDKSAKTPVVAR